MSNNLKTFFSKGLSNEAIAFYFITLILCSALFLDRVMPFYLLIFSVVELVAFYYYLNVLSKKWQYYSDKKIKQRIFESAFIIRLIYVVFIYFYYIEMTGEPFEFGAIDSLNYHTRAEGYAELQWEELRYHVQNQIDTELSDSGYPLSLTLIYSIIGSYILPIRILYALFDAWTGVLVYNLTKRNFGEATARIASIMALLLPNLIYYTGLHLKETLMVFLIVLFIERADLLIREKKVDFLKIIVLLFTGLLLFSFRTALGAAAFLSFFTALTFSQSKLVGWGKRVLIGSWIGISILFVFSGSIEAEVNSMIEGRGDAQQKNMEFRSTRVGGNELAKYGTAAVFAPIILAAPFPTFVNVEHQINLMFLSGAFYVRNVYAFFVILALFMLYKNKQYRNHLLIISFLLGYLVILVQSPFALSERFHLPVVPFLLIMAAYGIVNMSGKQRKLFVPYLILIAIVIVGWSWFKLAGRGIV